MAEPPLLAGAVQVRLIVVLPLAVAVRSVGAPGAVVPVVPVVVVTAAVSVPVEMPRAESPGRPVTVRVKTRSVPVVTGGIVTVGLAIESLSNVTVTPVVGVVSAQA